jgi:hypothetical protein
MTFLESAGDTISSTSNKIISSLPQIPSTIIQDAKFGFTIVTDIFWFFVTFIWTLLLLVIAVKCRNTAAYVIVIIIFLVSIIWNMINLIENLNSGSPKPNSGWIVVLIPEAIMGLFTYLYYRQYSYMNSIINAQKMKKRYHK